MNYAGSSWGVDRSTHNQVYNSFSSYVYSTHDVINGNDTNTVFFRETPPPVVQEPEPEMVEIPAVQLMTPMQVEEIPLKIAEVLSILVPVGLTIFGVLCLVYLLKSKRWQLW